LGSSSHATTAGILFSNSHSVDAATSSGDQLPLIPDFKMETAVGCRMARLIAKVPDLSSVY
jgi:hypothetical protein